MEVNEQYMKRCLELAAIGMGNVSPNPLVGSVIVHKDRIIGEGYHEAYGSGHAEYNAIHAVQDRAFLKDSTLYVNLEPCSHYGKTPPCADLIVEHGIPRVVVGAIDSNPVVAENGIAKMAAAGIEVVTGVLEDECRKLNKRFYCFHEKQRPYIMLRWAVTKNGFMSKGDRQCWISGPYMQRLNHQWRAHEDAIMVGTNTLRVDNPKLTNRLWSGKSPLRVAIDRKLTCPESHHLFDGSHPTLIFSEIETGRTGVEFIRTRFDAQLLAFICETLHKRGIQSLIVEGGTILLQHYIDQGLWDEARVLVGNTYWNAGIKGPSQDGIPVSEEGLGDEQLIVYEN